MNEISALHALPIGWLGFLLLWPISLWRRDASLVDFWWGPGIGAMALAHWIALGMPSDGVSLMLFGLLMLWSVRLGLQLGLRRVREGVEDPRYTALRDSWSPGWWWKSLFVVFVLQAFLQSLIAYGVLAAMGAGAGTVGPLAWLGAALSLGGIWVQSVADTELDRYRESKPHGGLLTTGLRAHVRHPNYTGEMAVWVGLALIALSAGVVATVFSAALVVFLLRYVSGVPIIEARMAETRAEFEAYRSRTPALLPRLDRVFGAGQSDTAPQ